MCAADKQNREVTLPFRRPRRRPRNSQDSKERTTTESDSPTFPLPHWDHEGLVLQNENTVTASINSD